jgi:hypothetical protein
MFHSSSENVSHINQFNGAKQKKQMQSKPKPDKVAGDI